MTRRNPYDHGIPAEESHRLRLYLSHPERYSLVQELFDGLFHDVDTRCSRVLKSLREEHVSGPDFIWRMYHLSPAELGSRDGCGIKTFRELSARLQIFRRHMLLRHLNMDGPWGYADYITRNVQPAD